MEDFNSKYTGEQVEEFLDQIANGEIGGGIEAETDPIFSASPAASITDAKKEEWDNKVDKVNGKQLSTEDFTSALKTKLEGLSNYDDTELSEALSTLRGDFDKLVSGDTTTAIKTFNEVIAFLDGLTDTQDLESIIASIEQQIAGKMDKVTLATVATSGSYNDLSNKPTIPSEQVNADWNATSGKAQILNKPTIPSAVTESTVSGWGFTKNTGTYSKPSGGIPKTDLASAVQTSLGKADAALSVNDAKDLYVSKSSVAGVDDSSLIDANIFIDPNSGIFYGLPSMSEHCDDVIATKNTLKTINGESILGSGNIAIEGGGSSGGGSGAYAEVNHGTSDTTFTLTPNTFHVWDEVASLTLTFGDETAGVANEFLFQFTSGSTPTTLTLPDSLKWANDTPPTIAENMIYQVSILKGLASVLEFSNAPSKITNTIKQNGTNLVFDYPVTSEVTVVFYGRAAGTASSSAPTDVTLVYSVGEQSKAIKSLFNFVSVTPNEDDTYIYTF